MYFYYFILFYIFACNESLMVLQSDILALGCLLPGRYTATIVMLDAPHDVVM